MNQLISLFLSICAAGTLSAMDVSRHVTHTPATLSSAGCHIKAIDGKATATFFRPAFQLEPGHHTIRVEIDREQSATVASHAKKQATLEFTAVEGHKYQIYKNQVIDLTDKYVPYDPEDDEQNG